MEAAPVVEEVVARSVNATKTVSYGAGLWMFSESRNRFCPFDSVDMSVIIFIKKFSCFTVQFCLLQHLGFKCRWRDPGGKAHICQQPDMENILAGSEGPL